MAGKLLNSDVKFDEFKNPTSLKTRQLSPSSGLGMQKNSPGQGLEDADIGFQDINLTEK